MSDENVIDLNNEAVRHRAKVTANKRLRRAHASEWQGYFDEELLRAVELRRSRGGNPEPTDGGAA